MTIDEQITQPHRAAGDLGLDGGRSHVREASPPTCRDDRGIVIIFTALLLVILMIFAALALDLGGLYNARRNDQNAADTSALGGAQSLGDTNADLIAEVKYARHTRPSA